MSEKKNQYQLGATKALADEMKKMLSDVVVQEQVRRVKEIIFNKFKNNQYYKKLFK